MKKDTRIGSSERYEIKAAKLQKLRESVTDVKAMLEAIEGARMNLSSANDAISSSIDEFRGQITVIKDRVTWLIRELDKLHTVIGRTTWPGDSR